jgi:hypothetical protein
LFSVRTQILAFLPRALRSALDASAADPSSPPLVSLGCSTNAIYALTVLSMWTVCPARFRFGCRGVADAVSD